MGSGRETLRGMYLATETGVTRVRSVSSFRGMAFLSVSLVAARGAFEKRVLADGPMAARTWYFIPWDDVDVLLHGGMAIVNDSVVRAFTTLRSAVAHMEGGGAS